MPDPREGERQGERPIDAWVVLIIAVLPLNTIALFSCLMEAGQYHFRAVCYAYLVYAVGASLLLILRWKVWTKIELVCLRWSWVPIIVLGVLWLVPALKAR